MSALPKTHPGWDAWADCSKFCHPAKRGRRAPASSGARARPGPILPGLRGERAPRSLPDPRLNLSGASAQTGAQAKQPGEGLGPWAARSAAKTQRHVAAGPRADLSRVLPPISAAGCARGVCDPFAQIGATLHFSPEEMSNWFLSVQLLASQQTALSERAAQFQTPCSFRWRKRAGTGTGPYEEKTGYLLNSCDRGRPCRAALYRQTKVFEGGLGGQFSKCPPRRTARQNVVD